MKDLWLCTYLLLVLITGCSNSNESRTEKIQRHRDNIVNVSDKIIDIKPEILFDNSALYILGDILIVSEKFPKGEKGIHLFNKNTFKYLASTGIMGKGPGEIVRPGPLGIDSKNRVFWVPDAGKRILFKFPLDSALNNSKFKPTEERAMNNTTMLSFGFLNDSIALGKAVHVISNSSFEMVMMKLNINTNLIKQFGYEHPKAVGNKSYSQFGMSVENNFYVNCYERIDLMTICDLEGNLKSNIYGPGWYDSERDKNSYFFEVDLIGKNIIASYIGDRELVVKGNITKGNAPKKFIVFDLDGNYLKTIETGFEFEQFCIDKENKRIIAYFIDREEPLGYFNIPD